MKNLFEMGANFDSDSKGWSCDNKDEPFKKESTETKAPNKHQLHISREKRRGKIVTIVKPFYLAKNDLQSLVKTIKKRLGTGGTVKDGSLEFQGEVSEKVRTHLEDLKFKFKT